MLRSDTLFGKRETTDKGPSTGTTSFTNTINPNIPKAATSVAQPSPAVTPAPSASSSTGGANNSSTNEVGSKLIVGPNIKLKGVEITDCDTLVVEGFVEATMKSRVMQIAEGGAFKGSAEIDIAEIRGDFDGDLTVRERLVIYSTGKVSGKIRYGKVVIEEGGEITGEVQAGISQSSPKTLSMAKPSM